MAEISLIGVAKVSVNGELFEFDMTRRLMSEAFALEEQTGMRFAEWEQSLSNGDLKGFCGLVWLIWHRDGRDIPFADIVSGKADFDIGELALSLKRAAEEAEAAADANPTGAVPRTTKAGTASTRGTTRRS